MKLIKFWLATFFLCASFILSSCYKQNISSKTDLSTNQEVYSQTRNTKVNIAENEHLFEEIKNDLFDFLTSKSSLNLHFLFADKNKYPKNYIISDFESISIEEFDTNIAYFEKIQEKLNTITPEYLSLKNQKTYKLLLAFINESIKTKGLALFYEPLDISSGIHTNLPILFYEYSFENSLDIHNYLNLLSNVDTYFKEIIEFEKQKKIAGLFMSYEQCDLLIKSLDSFLLSPKENFLKENFINKLNSLSFLDEEQKQTYINKHNLILEEDFYNAYEYLKTELTKLKNPISLSQSLPNKVELLDLKKSPSYSFKRHQKKDLEKLFNEYIILTSTYTSYENINTLKLAIKNNLNSDLYTISKLLSKNNKLYNFNYYPSLKEADEILDFFNKQINNSFPKINKPSYKLIYFDDFYNTNTPIAFFKKSKLDRSDNIIYINKNKLNDPSLYTTLAHEGIPGHLYMWSYINDKNLNNIDIILANKAYVEGFAVYAESLSFSMDKNLNKEEALFLEKNFTSTFALYALLDLEINYYKKDKNFVANYLKTSYNILDEDISNNIYNLLLSNPFKYLIYYTGFMEIINLKSEAKKNWKENYSDLKFNTFILDSFPLPFFEIKKSLNNK